jgi:hypothetical protein
MSRKLIAFPVLLALAVACMADEPAAPTETVIRLTAQPAPAPRPALRYQLLPELREMNPGNPVQGYMFCYMEQNNFWFSKEAVNNRTKWETMPLADLPLKEMLRFGYGKGSGPLRRADNAARLDKADWQILLRLKSEGAKLLLPEIQQMRMLGSALKVRFRVEVAERRFDDALTTAKTLFALSRHLGEHPTLISGLVGVAVANLALGPLEEMLQQPGCPNLYWALTNLPKPLVNTRNGQQSERMILDNVFDLLDEKAPMTEIQLTTAVERIQNLLKDLNDPKLSKPGGVKEWLTARIKDAVEIQTARQRLAAAGLAENQVKKFPVLQVILLDSKISYEVRRDDWLKALALPYWQGKTLLGDRQPPMKKEDQSLFAGLAGGFRHTLLHAQARLEQQLALLCCVEALRLHAAGNGGRFPAQLGEVKLPLPVDPVTGHPFPYKLEGETAILRGTPPVGMEKNVAYNIRFEVSIAK